MKPAAFAYHLPRTLGEAVECLARHAGEGASVLAGGQSLAPMMAFRLAKPAHIIDINSVAGLDRIEDHGAVLKIGALVRHETFIRNPPSGAQGALLASVASHIAHRPIRVRGTFCGSLAHADPASEWCLVATTLGATVHLASARGSRELAVENFIAGSMETALAVDELVTGVSIPRSLPGTWFGFQEFSRRAGDFALAMALVAFRIDRGAMRDVRLGVGAVEDKPRRLLDIEAMLEGQRPNADIFARASASAAATIQPLDTAQADATFRRELTQAMCRRALESTLAAPPDPV